MDASESPLSTSPSPPSYFRYLSLIFSCFLSSIAKLLGVSSVFVVAEELFEINLKCLQFFSPQRHFYLAVDRLDFKMVFTKPFNNSVSFSSI